MEREVTPVQSWWPMPALTHCILPLALACIFLSARVCHADVLPPPCENDCGWDCGRTVEHGFKGCLHTCNGGDIQTEMAATWRVASGIPVNLALHFAPTTAKLVFAGAPCPPRMRWGMLWISCAWLPVLPWHSLSAVLAIANVCTPRSWSRSS